MANGSNVVGELLELFGARRFVAMEQRARALLQANPGGPILHELLGLALTSQQRHGEALGELRRAVEAEPNDAQFWENLALCQRQLGDFAGSEASLRRSLALRPQAAETLNALGSVLRSQRRVAEAADVLRRALALDPTNIGARFNLATALFDGGVLGEAEGLVRQVLAAHPTLAAAHVCLGAILIETGRADEATAAAQKIIDIVGGLNGLSDAKADLLDLAANLFASAGRNGAAVQIYRATLDYRKTAARPVAVMAAARRVCDWDLADRIEPQCRATAQKPWTPGPGTVFSLLAVPSIGPAEFLSAARNYAQHFASHAPPICAAPRIRPDRLRIGYLTRDLTDYPGGYLVVGALEAHDRSRFEIVAYDYTPSPAGAFRDRIAAAFERLIRIDTLSDDEAARCIREDGCDIVIDLTGWTAGTRSRILAARPAPVQAQWLGFPGTMGAPWLDYIVADRVLIPAGAEAYYAEKVVRLPHCYQPTDNKRVVADRLNRRDYGLPEQAFVFCSFNQSYKITRQIFSTWMDLLDTVEGSVLWLLQSDPDAMGALQRAARARGIGSERLIFAPFMPPGEHLARIGAADLALDCFPYGSHTTASDMLWGGAIPLVALMGETFASRVSGSILTAAGLPDLIANSIDEYRALALRLAQDRGGLAEVKARVAQCRQTTPLFDTSGFTRHLEAALLAMWRRQEAGLPPNHITVD